MAISMYTHDAKLNLQPLSSADTHMGRMEKQKPRIVPELHMHPATVPNHDSATEIPPVPVTRYRWFYDIADPNIIIRKKIIERQRILICSEKPVHPVLNPKVERFRRGLRSDCFVIGKPNK